MADDVATPDDHDRRARALEEVDRRSAAMVAAQRHSSLARNANDPPPPE